MMIMRLICAGSRDQVLGVHYSGTAVERALAELDPYEWDDSDGKDTRWQYQLHDGGARGPDLDLREYLRRYLEIKSYVTVLPAFVPNWKLGRYAGFKRTTELLEDAVKWEKELDAKILVGATGARETAVRAIIVWDGESEGTRHTIEECERLHIEHKIIEVKPLPKPEDPRQAKLFK